MIENENVYQRIIDKYKETRSVNRTASEIRVSRVKVQRVLITEGLWTSKSSQLIGYYYKIGLTNEEIAKKLSISVKNVQAYIPYSRGEYGGKKTRDAIRCNKYRDRLKTRLCLLNERSEDALWRAFQAYQGYPFKTLEGEKFYTELHDNGISFKGDNIETSLTRATVNNIFHSILVRDVYEVDRAELSKSSEIMYLLYVFWKWKLLSLSGNEENTNTIFNG